MNQKTARALRKAAKYNPADDPQGKRKYRVLVCNRVPYVNGKPLLNTRHRTGQMIACRDQRMIYRIMKKRFKEKMI